MPLDHPQGIAGERIEKHDLVSFGPDGKVYRAAPALDPLQLKRVVACADPDSVRVTFTRPLTPDEIKYLAGIQVSIPTEARPLHMQAIDKIREDVEWVGPTGKRMGHVVLPRALGEALLKAIDNDPNKLKP